MLQMKVISEEGLLEYRKAVKPLMEKFGAKPIIRGAKIDLLEGQGADRPISLFEFPSMQALHDFWESPEYAAIKPLRAGSADIDIWAIPGL
ncbi:DUF1330 domain-containing protein [Sphingobium lactosutens]|nr:DUF1330 domain-containing protein [Sphingobium lactosutens]